MTPRFRSPRSNSIRSETDVTKVFVEPAPTRKIDMTGTHEKIVLKSTGTAEPDDSPATRTFCRAGAHAEDSKDSRADACSRSLTRA